MSFETLKVLLVEDDINTRSTIRTMLAEIGVSQVFEAEDGAQADAFFARDLLDIDLVISDWNMPNQSGLELLQNLRQVKPDLPFIMVTGRGDAHSMQDAMDAKVTRYIRKPFTLSELEHKISQAV